MAVPNKPSDTRLRWVRSSQPESIEKWTRAIGVRVQIYSVNFARGKWYVWFVPGDNSADMKSGDLDG